MRNYLYSIPVILLLQIITHAEGRVAKHPKIHNGDEANPNHYRWMVWIKRNGVFVCGGGLLKAKFVITAAQCVDRVGAYEVVLGDYDRGSRNGDEQIVNVAQIYLHPDWNRMRLDNDIALLELETRANLSGVPVRRIQVKNLSNSTVDQLIVSNSSVTCMLHGWGYTTYEGVWMLSPLLQSLEINLQNDTRCSEILMGAFDPVTRLCFENDDSGACLGDNGGPWMCQINDVWNLVGIHSYGVMHDGCRAGGRAGTRISYYSDWILSITQGDDTDERRS